MLKVSYSFQKCNLLTSKNNRDTLPVFTIVGLDLTRCLPQCVPFVSVRGRAPALSHETKTVATKIDVLQVQ
jgi:hypothetical protein